MAGSIGWVGAKREYLCIEVGTVLRSPGGFVGAKHSHLTQAQPHHPGSLYHDNPSVGATLAYARRAVAVRCPSLENIRLMIDGVVNVRHGGARGSYFGLCTL